MTTQEIVNGHKFRNPLMQRLCTQFVETEDIEVNAFDESEIHDLLVELAKERTKWTERNRKASVDAKEKREAERRAKDVIRRFGGKSVEPTLNDAERTELEKARTFLAYLGISA